MVFLWLAIGGFLGYIDWKKTFNETDFWYSIGCACLGPGAVILILFHIPNWRY